MKWMPVVPAVVTALVLGGTAAPAVASPTVHTLTLKAVQTAETDYKNGFVIVDRDYRNGVLVGRDVLTCRFNLARHVINCTIAFALRQGLIAADFTLTDSQFFQGRIVGGTRAYSGIHGVLQGATTGSGAFVQLTYTR